MRVRTNTGRRTANRSELLSLAGPRRPTGAPVRQLDATIQPWGNSTYKLVITNTGTIDIHDIDVRIPEGSEARRFGTSDGPIPLLKPSEQEAVGILRPSGMGSSDASVRIEVHGVAADGELVISDALLSQLHS